MGSSIADLYKQGLSQVAISQRLGITRWSVRKALVEAGLVAELRRGGSGPSVSGVELDDRLPDSVDIREGVTRFLITSALNNTPVFTEQLRTMEAWSRRWNAQILVVPVRYQNPSLLAGKAETEWPVELDGYYCCESVPLGDRALLMANVRVQATAARPLQGLGGMSGRLNGIVGHSRLALEYVPSAPGDSPLCLISTGSVSFAQYSDTKAGVVGEFHHCQAALVVEVDGSGGFWYRWLEFDRQGGCWDLDGRYYRGEDVTPGDIPALILGDIHVGAQDPDCAAAVGRFLRRHRVRNLVLHDVLDGYSISHHHDKDKFRQYAKLRSGRDDLMTELSDVLVYLRSVAPRVAGSVWVVASNHHDHLDQWLRSPRAEDNKRNLKLYHWLSYKLCESIDSTGGSGDIEAALNLFMADRLPPEVRLLSRNDSLVIEGVDCAQHGDVGPGGGRGSASGFARSQRKTIVGHSHTPRAVDGCLQVGTSSRIPLEYAVGYNAWDWVHAVVYPGGGRTLFNICKGRYMMEEEVVNHG